MGELYLYLLTGDLLRPRGKRRALPAPIRSLYTLGLLLRVGRVRIDPGLRSGMILDVVLRMLATDGRTDRRTDAIDRPAVILANDAQRMVTRDTTYRRCTDERRRAHVAIRRRSACLHALADEIAFLTATGSCAALLLYNVRLSSSVCNRRVSS